MSIFHVALRMSQSKVDRAVVAAATSMLNKYAFGAKLTSPAERPIHLRCRN
jgi:hypothetical protein